MQHFEKGGFYWAGRDISEMVRVHAASGNLFWSCYKVSDTLLHTVGPSLESSHTVAGKCSISFFAKLWVMANYFFSFAFLFPAPFLFGNPPRPLTGACRNADWSCWLDLVQVTRVAMSSWPPQPCRRQHFTALPLSGSALPHPLFHDVSSIFFVGKLCSNIHKGHIPSQYIKCLKLNTCQDRGYNSVMTCLPSMAEAPTLMPSIIYMNTDAFSQWKSSKSRPQTLPLYLLLSHDISERT